MLTDLNTKNVKLLMELNKFNTLNYEPNLNLFLPQSPYAIKDKWC